MSVGALFVWRGEYHRIIAVRHYSGLVLVRRERDGDTFGVAPNLIMRALARGA